MAENKCEAMIKKLKKELDSMWLTCPEEVNKIKETQGSNGTYLGFAIYAERDVSSQAAFLFWLTRLALKGTFSLQTLKDLTKLWLEANAYGFRRWFQFADVKYLPALYGETVEALGSVESIDQYHDLIGALLLVVGKYGFWLDLLIPWYQLNETYVQLK